MTSGEHLGENAELYALGVLEPEERASVEQHIADCAQCLREVGEAEAAVAALDDATIPQVQAPAALGRRLAASAAAVRPSKVIAFRPRWSVPPQLAMAASLALFVGLGGGFALDRSVVASHVPTRDEQAIATVAASHFLHASFTPVSPGAPTAKVLYSRDGSWYYVIVDAAIPDCHVIAHSQSGALDAGLMQPGTETSTLFVHPASRPQTLELTRGGQVIATATLAQPKTE